jgi:hypothetical protein
MILYILQVAVFQLVFLMVYDAFLKRETFFNWNRVYLLSTALLSIVIPYIKLEVFRNTIPQQYIINLPEVIIGNSTPVNQIQLETVVIDSKPFWNWETLFYLGIILATLLFVFKIAKVIRMLVKNPKNKLGKLIIVNLLNSNSAFSFFHYICLGERLAESDKAAILKHEIVHVNQMHTADLLFFEVMRILFWFNPLVYMYQNRIMTLHEFIADQEAAKHQDKTHYYQNLLSQVFQTQNISFINPFFKQSLIKKRIVMLQKSKSKQIKLLKYALLIPLVLGMLVYSSCEKENETKQTDVLDLSQYNYTRKMGEGQMSGENKEIHDKHIAILKENPEYAQWIVFDEESKTVSYSVHSEDENLPKELEPKLGKAIFRERAGSNKMYFLFKRLQETEESNKQKEEGLLKQTEIGKNEIEVPFEFIEHVPVFPGCEGITNEEQKKCMSDEITKHVGKNFNTNIAKEHGLTGRQRISVIFKIDKEGNTVGVRSRAAHPALEAEAVRVVNTLPKFKPGMQKGKAVGVPYALPIVFEVN